MLLRSLPGCLIAALESIACSLELGFSPKEWHGAQLPQTAVLGKHLYFINASVLDRRSWEAWLSTSYSDPGNFATIQGGGRGGRGSLTSAFSSEELCSWHCLYQTPFTDWAGLSSVLTFCLRAKHSSSSPASRRLGLSNTSTCGVPVPPAFPWGTDCPSPKQQSHWQWNDTPQPSPRALESCEVLTPLRHIWEGVVWCCSKEGTCCNPSTGQRKEKSSLPNHAAPTFLRRTRSAHLRSLENTVKEMILAMRVLLITSQLTLNEETCSS